MTPLGIHACAAITLLALTAEGKWDFTSSRVADFKWVGCRVLAVTKESVMVTTHNKVETYPFHHRLASGWFNLLGPDGFSYCRDDLKAGDQICLNVLQAKSQPDYCVSFGIRERPGGKVPPTRRYKPGDWKPTHEVIEAFREYEKNGVPVPPHLDFGSKPYKFPAYDPNIPRRERFARFPFDRPFTYIELALFLR